MTALLWIIGLLIFIVVGGYVIRALGRAISWPSKNTNVYFRDMAYLGGVGLAVALLGIITLVYYYFIAPTPFFVWAVNGFIFFAIAAFIFRLLGRNVGTEGTKKLFRQMPLTAAFGVLVIIVYAVTSVFAGFIAPYGQEEVFAKANLLPGGDAATGGDPAHLLGTDQIGRDILSRIIFGAQNTVGIAFVTTCLAFLIGTTMGFLAAIKGGWIDQLTSRIVDALMAIPQLIFALLLMTIATAWAGSNGFLVTVYMVLIIAVLDSTRVYRLSRAVGLNIVVMDYIEAAKLRGETLGYLVFKEILPNAFAPQRCH